MLNRIKRYIKDKKEKRSFFNGYANFMCPGVYVFDDSFTYFYRKNDPAVFRHLDHNYTKLMLKRCFLRKLTSCLLKIFFLRPVQLEEKKQIGHPGFQGSLFLIGSQGKEHKVFDLNHNRVLRLYSDRHAFNKKLRLYEQLKTYFLMPSILEYNSKELYVVEKLISAKHTGQWSKSDYLDVILDVFHKETLYLMECKSKKAYILKGMQDLLADLNKNSPIVEFLLSKLSSSTLELEFPFVKLHGDLWSSNILFGKCVPHEIYYIDWEKSRSYVFFYDLYYLMLNECYIKSNYLYAEKYMDGEFDKLLEAVYQIFGMDFEPNRRIDYLYITLLNQYKERWTLKGKNEERKIGKQWKLIIQRIEEMTDQPGQSKCCRSYLPTPGM
ncbi:MAG: hypothetical protein ACOX25_02675 [Caldicoprobacterales bacterium]|jgi:hypothetical protein|nr:hypothetical protein [Clostridiales bacterium]